MVAGEESGDQHAAELIRDLLTIDPSLRISGIGGDHMQQAGASIIFNLARHGVTGLSEVLRSFPLIKHAMRLIQKHLETTKPDCLVLIDYPGFNLRLARFAKEKLGLKVVYYISPQIWAWKANRIHTIKRTVDLMACIFPFEKEIYIKAGVPVAYVGHPLIQKIQPVQNIMHIRDTLGLSHHKKIIALLPGSRLHEIERHMPVMVKTIEMLLHKDHDLHFVIPVAATIPLNSISSYLVNVQHALTVFQGHSLEVAGCSDCVVVASGTASLECALLEKPMCIIYKVSTLTAMIAALVVRVKYLGLINLLADKMIAPELLQYDCTPEALSQVVWCLLHDEPMINNMVGALKKKRHELSQSNADGRLAELICELIDNKFA